MEALVWLRVPGDIVFAAGSVLLAIYALRLLGRAAPRTGVAPATAMAHR
jgi:nitric oxide reductase subunit B